MFSRRVIFALRAASSQADFTEILLEAFQEDGDHGAVEAQVVTDGKGTFWSDWAPLERLLIGSGVSFATGPGMSQATVPRIVEEATVESAPWLGTDLWFQTAARYTIDFARPPYI